MKPVERGERSGVLGILRRWFGRAKQAASQPGAAKPIAPLPIDCLATLFSDPPPGATIVAPPSPAAVPPEALSAADPSNLLPCHAELTGCGWQVFECATSFASPLARFHPDAAVVGHRLQITTDLATNLAYGQYVSGTVIPGETYVLSAAVWVPAGFRGRDVHLVGVGYPATVVEHARLDVRDAWQRISAIFPVPKDGQGVNCGIMITGLTGDEIHSTAWKLERGTFPTAYNDPSTALQAGVVLGYAYNQGGMNNQKLALLGLFIAARDSPSRQLRLPRIRTDVMASWQTTLVPLPEVFALDQLQRFAASRNIEITEGPPLDCPGTEKDARGWQYFKRGFDFLDIRAAEDDFAADFFHHLRPVTQHSLVADLKRRIFTEHAINVVAQLRIEKDWTDFAAMAFRETGEPVNFRMSFIDIILKIRRSLGREAERIFVVCDEATLPLDKDVIRDIAQRDCQTALFWKSDFLTPDILQAMTSLDQAMLDFELAAAAPIFVGNNYSSFANLVSFECHARDVAAPQRHYLYNYPGDLLGRRIDNGTSADPLKAAVPVVP